MPLDARRLLAFSDAMNERWWPWIEKAPADLLTAPVDFSFLTPLGILTHMANIEHAWGDAIEGAPVKWARVSTKAFAEPGPVLDHAREARRRTHALVDGLDDAGLARSFPLDPAWKFAIPSMTVEQALFTVFTHEQWHRGELLAACWSRNVEPPIVDWPRYGLPLGPPAEGVGTTL